MTDALLQKTLPSLRQWSIRKITFTETAFSQYLYWQTQDKRTLKKINQLLQSIDRDGALGGIGKLELLKHLGGDYSRRIDEQNHLVYTVTENTIIVKACKGHYEN